MTRNKPHRSDPPISRELLRSPVVASLVQGFGAILAAIAAVIAAVMLGR